MSIAAAPAARGHRRVLWFIPAFLALHNLEEALTFPRFLPRVRASIPESVSALATTMSNESLYIALLVATVVPLGIVAWAQWRPSSRIALWLSLLVQAVLALNVVWHVVVAAFVLHGYAPGLVTAVVVNAPFGVYLFRHAARERWLDRGALYWLAPAAVLVHGPLLLGLVVSTGRLVRA